MQTGAMNMNKLPYSIQFKALQYLPMPMSRGMVLTVQKVLRVLRFRQDERLEVRRTMISSYDGANIPVLIAEPSGIGENAPCLFYIHGGGFMLPASTYHYNCVREYAIRGKCKVIFPDYRLSTQYSYPTAHEDCYAAYQWMLLHAGHLGIDTERIVIGGDSAGGDLAAGITLMIRDRGLTMPCMMMLIYPVMDRRMSTKSAWEITQDIVTRRCRKLEEAFLQ